MKGARWRISLAFIFLAVLCLSTPRPAASQSYTITDLGSFYPYAINNRGQVVGVLASGRAALWEDGVVTDLGASMPERVNEITSINEAGQVVGYYFVERSSEEGPVVQEHAFLWQNGVFTDLGTLGGRDSYAYDINDAGQVVGYSSTPRNESISAFIWQNGAMNALPSVSGEAAAINNIGHVAGSAEFGRTRIGIPIVHAVIWRNGVMTDLGTFGYDGSFGVDINDAGQVLVYAMNQSNDPSVSTIRSIFLWQGGRVTSLATDIQLLVPVAINNSGQVVSNSPRGPYLWQNDVRSYLQDLLPRDSGWTFSASTIIEGINDGGQIVGLDIIDGEYRGFLMSPESGLIVNSAGDEPDTNTRDGMCYTGRTTREEELECTLRAAIQQANADAGNDIITFDIPAGAAEGTFVIRPTSPLPPITDSVIIDGSTQPGAHRIELDGAAVGAATNGLHIGAENVAVRVRALTIRGFSGDGISRPRPGQVALENVSAIDNRGMGIYVNGALAVSGGANEVRGNGRGGVFSAGTMSISDIVVRDNCGEGIRVGAAGLAITGSAQVTNNGNADALGRACATGGGVWVAQNMVQSGARPLLVSGNGGNGITVGYGFAGPGSATLEDVRAIDNRGYGIDVNGALTISGGANEVRGNGRGGVLSAGTMTIMDIVVRDNCGLGIWVGAAGLAISGSAQVTNNGNADALGNPCATGGGVWVAQNMVQSGAKPLLVSGNGGHGIKVGYGFAGPGDATLEDVRVIDNRGYGIDVNGLLAISGGANEVRGNAQGGVFSRLEMSVGDIVVRDNCGEGIWVGLAGLLIGSAQVTNNGNADARGNPCALSGGGILAAQNMIQRSGTSLVVSGNGGDGIKVGFNGSGGASLENVMVIDNRKYGISVDGTLTISGADNKVTRNKGSGIATDTLRASNLTVEGNARDGIQAADIRIEGGRVCANEGREIVGDETPELTDVVVCAD